MSRRPRSTGRNGLGSTSAPNSRGDRLGGGVGLLGGDAALLDRAGGCVTRGVHVVEALDAAVQIHWDEAVAVVGEPRDIRPDDARKAHHLVGGKRRPGSGQQLALARLHRHAVGQQLDAALLEQLSHRGGGRRPEQLERLRLVRDQLERTLRRPRSATCAAVSRASS